MYLEILEEEIRQFLHSQKFDLKTIAVRFDAARDPAHGHVTTNIAMLLARTADQSPRDLADLIAARLRQNTAVETAEVAGPGFVNLRLTRDFWWSCLREIVVAGSRYGQSGKGASQRVNVEYVSANPTGPMHIGHARGAVVGDVMANLLAYIGYTVTREYYINDAGAQIDILARSVYWRYQEKLGKETGPLPEGLYPGDYLIPVGEALAKQDGTKWLDKPESQWLERFRDFAVQEMMTLIKADLQSLGVHHDSFVSEKKMMASKEIEKTLETLTEKGLIYEGVLPPPKGKKSDDWEERPQTLFASTRFGDDVDRPLKKSDGSWTYFAADMAYHHNKINRKESFQLLIDVWGSDHKGYVKRMQAAVESLSRGLPQLKVILTDLVHLSEGGKPLKMSKRAGSYITLRKTLERVGGDVIRFMMLTRRNDQTLDFDLEKAVAQSRDNPVFYVQYAHTRCVSLFRLAKDRFPEMDFRLDSLRNMDLSALTDEDELALIRKLSAWPGVIEQAARACEPHRCTSYLYEVASAFHGLWTKGKESPDLRFILPHDETTTRARLLLVHSVRCVIVSGLEILGVKPVEEM